MHHQTERAGVAVLAFPGFQLRPRISAKCQMLASEHAVREDAPGFKRLTFKEAFGELHIQFPFEKDLDMINTILMFVLYSTVLAGR